MLRRKSGNFGIVFLLRIVRAFNGKSLPPGKDHGREAAFCFSAQAERGLSGIAGDVAADGIDGALFQAGNLRLRVLFTY